QQGCGCGGAEGAAHAARLTLAPGFGVAEIAPGDGDREHDERGDVHKQRGDEGAVADVVQAQGCSSFFASFFAAAARNPSRPRPSSSAATSRFRLCQLLFVWAPSKRRLPSMRTQMR